jgi:hypothetical protein
VSECQHENFSANVEVNRITRGEGGPVYTFNVSVTVECAQCKMPLSFEGLPRGVNLDEPVTGPWGIEARLPAHILHEEDKRPEPHTVVIPNGGLF